MTFSTIVFIDNNIECNCSIPGIIVYSDMIWKTEAKYQHTYQHGTVNSLSLISNIGC